MVSFLFLLNQYRPNSLAPRISVRPMLNTSVATADWRPKVLGGLVRHIQVQVAHTGGQVVQVGPDQGQRHQLDEPAGHEPRPTLKAALEAGKRNSEDTEVSNIQITSGSRMNISIPLTR